MSDLETIRMAVIMTMKELGYDLKSDDGTISQNQANKILKRSKVEKGMKNGSIRWTKEDMNSNHCPVRVNRSDVFKLKNK